MDKKMLKEALEIAAKQENEQIETAMQKESQHIFSEEFENKMKLLIDQNSRGQVSARRNVSRRFAVIAVAIMMTLVACVGFTYLKDVIVKYWFTKDAVKEQGNYTMGRGEATYDGENVYFIDRENDKLCIYNLSSGVTTSISVESEIGVRANIFVQEQYIYYAGKDGLKRVSKDGKHIEQVFEHGLVQIYVDGNDIIFLESIESGLFYRNQAENVEQEILKHVLSYYVDETHIYAVARENDIPFLFIAERESMEFKKVSLSFIPITVYVEDNILYLAERGSYQLIKVSEGKEERLPIYSTHYQVQAHQITYLAEKKEENGFPTLRTYDMVSKDNRLIADNVSDFGLFEDKYIYLQQVINGDTRHYLYDYQEMNRMK